MTYRFLAAGKSTATQTGVALSAASLVLATLQQDRSGVYVRSAVPNVAASSFTVHLSKAVTASTSVAWFVATSNDSADTGRGHGGPASRN